MMQLKLAKETRLPCPRMSNHDRTNLTCAQTVIVFPFIVHSRLAAILFHRRFVVGTKEALPTHVNPIRIIPDVHHFLLLERVADLRIEELINGAAIDDRCLAALLCRLNAVEPDLARPAMHVGAFVMKEDRLLGWVRR